MHRFSYALFIFCLELNELESGRWQCPGVGIEKPGLFSFYSRDHFAKNAKPLSEKAAEHLTNAGIGYRPGKIFMVGHLRFLGYVFNPVTFYFFYDETNTPYASLAEVRNTYGEVKVYALDNLRNNRFIQKFTKHFYISPFSEPDTDLSLRLSIPDRDLKLIVNEADEKGYFFFSHLTGTFHELTFWRLIGFSLRFPFITLSVITRIHWQAMLIWLRNIPYLPKNHKASAQQPSVKK